jgi:hypothetical protein
MRTVSFFRGTADVFGELGGGGVGRFSDSLMGKIGETEISGNSSLAGSVVRRQSPFSVQGKMHQLFSEYAPARRFAGNLREQRDGFQVIEQIQGVNTLA